MRDLNLLILFVFVVLVLSIVTLSGNLHAGPRLVDDNQIFKLDRDIRDQGFYETSREHFSDRIFRMGRLVPVYLVHKLLLHQGFRHTDSSLVDLRGSDRRIDRISSLSDRAANGPDNRGVCRSRNFPAFDAKM